MRSPEYTDAPVDGWEVCRTSTICDGLVIRYTRKGEREISGLEISASRNGVLVSGCDIARLDVGDIVLVIAQAREDALWLRSGSGAQ